MNIYNKNKTYHAFKWHEKLSCQFCHSSWMPQCYGCHISYRKYINQRDWLSEKISTGKWEEKRSYMRFLKPALGMNENNKIAPIAQSQVFVSLFDSRGNYIPEKSFNTFSISSFDPHTTTKNSRTCIDYHFDPKTLGFVNGILYYKNNKNIPVEGFLDAGAQSFQTEKNKKGRSFNKHEIKNILNVAPCLPCHHSYDDRIYNDFSSSFKKFSKNKNLPCFKKIK